MQLYQKHLKRPAPAENLMFVQEQTTDRDHRSLALSAHTVARALYLVIGVLFIAHAFSVWLDVSLSDQSRLRLFIHLYFNFDTEANIPTFFSAFILLTAAALLFYIYKTSRQNRRYWLALSLIFVFLCLDEATQIHERLIRPLNRLFVNLPAFLSPGWVIPYLLFVLAVSLTFAGFFWRLPRKTKRLFLLSGGIYVGGALGIEFLEGIYFHLGYQHLKMILIYTLQEVLEMIGIALFIYSLLDYILPGHRKLRLTNF